MSFERLIEKIDRLDNPTVAGLDPKLEMVPAFIQEECFARETNPLQAAANAILAFNKALIDALYDIVPAVKPQCAYYELLGFYGVQALAETIAYAKNKGMFVITDGKRNDIGTTMTAYAQAQLGEIEVQGRKAEPFGSDALTVNGYLGTDGIAPLLDICKQRDKGIFVLVKTSNPSSGELQDLQIQGEEVYCLMGRMCEKWGEDTIDRFGYSAVGAVVGATYPTQLATLRHKMPHTFFLVPGYGAQGGGAADIAGAFDAKGRGAVINASRSIMTAWKKENCPPEEFAQAARREALRMKEDINSVRKR